MTDRTIVSVHGTGQAANGVTVDVNGLLFVMDEAGTPPPVDIERARSAVSTLRDAAREGRVIDYRERDPLVVIIHLALDELEASRKR